MHTHTQILVWNGISERINKAIKAQQSHILKHRTERIYVWALGSLIKKPIQYNMSFVFSDLKRVVQNIHVYIQYISF